MRRRFFPAVAVVAVVGLAACTQSTFRETAEGFIEDDDAEVAEKLGVTFDDATCDDPANKDVDTTFTCTAVASDGATYSFLATITGRNQFTVAQNGPPIPGGQGSVPPASVPPASTPPTSVPPASTPPTSAGA